MVASTNGVSGIIAPDGTVLDRAGTRTQDVLVERIALDSAITPAVRLGAWIGWLCAGAVVVGLLLELLAYRRMWQRNDRRRQPEHRRSGTRRGRPDLQRSGQSRLDRRSAAPRAARHRRAGGRRPLAGRHRPDRRQARRRRPQVKVLHRAAKGGLGGAYLHGFAHALAAGYDVIGEMDADGSHQPEQLSRLLVALDGADLVIGARWVRGGSVVNWPLQRELLSRGGNLYVRLLLGIGVGTPPRATASSGVRRSEKIDLATVRSTGYVFQTDLVARTLRAGLVVREVPIEFVERVRGESKMSGAVAVESLRKITAWGVRERAAQVRRGLRRRGEPPPPPHGPRCSWRSSWCRWSRSTC